MTFRGYEDITFRGGNLKHGFFLNWKLKFTLSKFTFFTIKNGIFQFWKLNFHFLEIKLLTFKNKRFHFRKWNFSLSKIKFFTFENRIFHFRKLKLKFLTWDTKLVNLNVYTQKLSPTTLSCLYISLTMSVFMCKFSAFFWHLLTKRKRHKTVEWH